MERKMTKTENILDNIALTNLFLIFLAIMSACISVNTIERLPIVVRHILSFLHDHAVLFSLMNFGIMIISSFWLVMLGKCLDTREQERVNKYILENQSNTKSRLELTKLQERGYWHDYEESKEIFH